MGQKQKTKREKKEKEEERPKVGNNIGQVCIATPPRVAHIKPPGPKRRGLNHGNNNGQLRIATPPRVAHTKMPGPKKRLNDGNNNGQLRIANTTSGGARKAAWANLPYFQFFCPPTRKSNNLFGSGNGQTMFSNIGQSTPAVIFQNGR